MNITRRNFTGSALTLSVILLLAGCGSGGSDGSATTRARVKKIDGALGSRSQFDPLTMLIGYGNKSSMADSLGGFLGSNGLPAVGLGGAAYSRAKSARTRGEATGFYYDGYLKLWAQKTQTDTDTTTEVRYDFFVDEAKTQPGGFMSSLQPKWNVYPIDVVAQDGAKDIGTLPPAFWNPTYPQTYKTEYRFTAGTLAGSHGLSETTTEADYSTTSKYENVYADGWKDGGSSHSDSGGSTWSSRIDTPDGKFAEAAGTFRSAIGGSRMSSSDGYSADYQFSASGSGHGTISGPDPGLPVTSSWDASGNVVVKYADGTTETFTRSGYYGQPIPVDGGDGTGNPPPIPVEGDGGIGTKGG